MPGFNPFEVAKDKAGGLFARNTNTQYEAFEYEQKDGYEKTFGGGPSPESLPSPERPPLRHIDTYIKAEIPGMTKRYTVALLACIGFGITFGMRCNMSMAKLKMEGQDAKNVTFEWTVAIQSTIDSSYFAGYFLTQLPGGFLASLYPANKIFGLAVVMSATLNLFIPLAMSAGAPMCVVAIKVAQGFVEGVTYPACHGIWRHWAPPLERSRLATMAFCGTYAGIVVGMPLSGTLTDTIGWQAPFYFYGVFGLTWFAAWLWLVFERPSKHPTISARELMYIEQSLGQTQTSTVLPSWRTTPWKEFATSMPVYAIIVANFCRTWNFSLLVNFQSAYLKNMFQLSVTESGFVGAIPHLLMTTLVPFGGMLADYLRKNQILTTTAVRKLFNCGGFGMEAFFFVLVAYAKDEFTATSELTAGVAFSGFAISGYNVNHLDIAPRYASILMGLSNGIGTIAGFLVPIIIDHIILDKDVSHDLASKDWKEVFLLAATVHFIGITFYGIFASGELQPWAEPPPDENSIGWAKQKSVDSVKETSFTSGPQAPLTSTGAPSYGSTAPPPRPAVLPPPLQQISSTPSTTSHVSGNPFVSQHYSEPEPVQPPAYSYQTDNY